MSVYRYIHDSLRFEELFNQTCRIIIICRHFVSVYTVSMKLNIRIYDSNIAVINFIINVCHSLGFGCINLYRTRKVQCMCLILTIGSNLFIFLTTVLS